MDIASMHATFRKMKLAELEKWTKLAPEDLGRAMKNASVHEWALLRTCNRFEVYAAAPSAARFRDALGALADSMGTHNIYFLEGVESQRHLMEVCSGLDSMVVGEQEIQRQVKESLGAAQKEGRCGKTINYMFMKAISTGKEVREKTAVTRGVVSIPQAVARVVAGHKGIGSVCVVGTGQMAKSVMGSLRGAGFSMTVCGRREGKARELAALFSARASGMEGLDPSRFDVVITAVSAQCPVLHMAGGDMPRLVIDMGNPRNVEGAWDGQYVSLDDLKKHVHRNMKVRKGDVRKANEIISRNAASAGEKLRMMDAEAVISQMYMNAERARASATARALTSIGEEHRRTVDDMTRSLTNAILADQTARIKSVLCSGDKAKIAALMEIYGGGGSGGKE